MEDFELIIKERDTMSFKLTFSKLRGNEESTVYLEQNIENVEFNYDSPNDVTSKAANSNMTLVIKGKINDTNDEATLKLINDWIRLEGQEKGAYCQVKLEVIGRDERFIRQYEFSDAFVVDYNERFTGSDGVGEFEIYIRQKRDMFKGVILAGGFFE